MGWLTALKLDVAYIELLMDHPGEKQYAVVMNKATVSQMRMKSERNNEELASLDNCTDNHSSHSTPFLSPWTAAMRMKPPTSSDDRPPPSPVPPPSHLLGPPPCE